MGLLEKLAGLAANPGGKNRFKLENREGSNKTQFQVLHTMNRSPRRKTLALIFGAVLVTALGAVFWPFFTGPGRMQEFCGALRVGTSPVEIREQATQRGYRMSALRESGAFVYDSAAFGRFTCSLNFGPQGLVSAAYAFND